MRRLGAIVEARQSRSFAALRMTKLDRIDG